MTNPSADDLYQRLGIDSEASDPEIKKAFFKAVRVHPPEKDPENYKLIREAYDTLYNPQSRQEYDSRLAYGPEIEALEEELVEAREEEDINAQIRLLKKLIILLPDVGLHRNRLGLVFMEDEESGLAINQFVKALAIDSRNPTYIINCGHAYEQDEQYDRARSMFERAWELDPEDYAAPRALSSLLYHNMNEKEKAHSVLDKAILADDKVDFQDFFCMHDKIMFYVFERDEDAVERETERISGVATSEADRSFASYTFASLAYQLIQWKGFRMAQKLADAALSLRPDDDSVQELAKNAGSLGMLEREVDALLERRDFPDPLKFLLSTLWQLNFGDEDDPEVQEQKRSALEALPVFMDAEPYRSDVDAAIGIIQREYPNVWEWQDDFFRHLQGYPPAGHCMLVCTNCNNKARADRSAATNAAGLQCPKCHSTGPFRREKGAFESSTPPTIPQKSGGGGCFVATAIYRGYDHPDVRTFRLFRDQFLMRCSAGRRAVSVYYRFGPGLARRIHHSHWASRGLRCFVFEPAACFLRQFSQRCQ